MSATTASRGLSITGYVLSGLIVILLLVDAVMKLLALPVVLQTTADLGYPVTGVRALGLLLLLCTVLYAFPRTAVIGAVLLTAYLGGAVATHVRVGSPLLSHVLFGVYLGVAALGRSLPAGRSNPRAHAASSLGTSVPLVKGSATDAFSLLNERPRRQSSPADGGRALPQRVAARARHVDSAAAATSISRRRRCTRRFGPRSSSGRGTAFRPIRAPGSCPRGASRPSTGCGATRGSTPLPDEIAEVLARRSSGGRGDAR